uniref:3'-5' exonuclease n=1 Tax=Falsiroseomonas oryzae TaxID=2766473 RepID=UPI0022EB3CCD
RLDALTPAEALDAVIAALDLPQRLRGWGEATARLANLEALRGLARAHEETCRQGGLPATATGLCAALAADTPEEPPSPDPEAVRVLTVHAAKGLEWPVVVLAELDKAPRDRLFDSPVAMPREGALDLADPLAGRWIRLWPWPYGDQKTKVGLDASAAASDTGKDAAEAARREAVRLLYVAMTRARDWLVLAPRLSPAGVLEVAWLDALGPHRPVLPATGTDEIEAGGTRFACGIRDILPDTAAPAAAEAPPVGPLRIAIATTAHLPRRIRPSGLATGGPAAVTLEELGPRLPLVGSPDMAALGEAVHGFLAGDDDARPRGDRLVMAEALLRRWGVSALAPEDVVTAGDRLWAWLRRRWPGCSWRSEVPVLQRQGAQMLVGRVDLLVRHEAGLAVIDHKSFPGGRDQALDRAAAHQPQLDAYAAALAAAEGRPVTDRLIHLPVVGVLLALASSAFAPSAAASRTGSASMARMQADATR